MKDAMSPAPQAMLPTQNVGYVDLQINGLMGVDFNAATVSDTDWELASQALGKDGTTHVLPTIITDSIPALETKLRHWAHRCDRIDTAVRVMGIHLEGPFISAVPGFVGAHPPQHTRTVDMPQLQRLMEAAEGHLSMVTLAPECDPNGLATRFLADRGVLVAAGHTDATLDQLKRTIDCGLSLFTHLGNACPSQLARHDNILHRALSLRDSLRYTLIADGHHVPPWLLKSWIDWIGCERVAIVSDAISAAGLPAGSYRLGDRVVDVGGDGVPRSQDRSHFVGSGATLGVMDRWLQTTDWFSPAQRRQLLSSNALQWLGQNPS
jgi:N-acetylglucosamine-6-phosphate deacetylase